jgi:DNA polymerase-4
MVKDMNLPERLYLDFDSFFASAEQHFNPALRAKPIGVLALDSPHAGCIAVSREAKARGVKSNMSAREARKIIPDMIFVVARPDVYVSLHNRIMAVIETVVPILHVRSIDEVVCALLPSEGREGLVLAERIKEILSQNFSSVLTCSIGLAATELLAKLAAERCKPNGTFLLDPPTLPSKHQRGR